MPFPLPLCYNIRNIKSLMERKKQTIMDITEDEILEDEIIEERSRRSTCYVSQGKGCVPKGFTEIVAEIVLYDDYLDEVYLNARWTNTVKEKLHLIATHIRVFYFSEFVHKEADGKIISRFKDQCIIRNQQEAKFFVTCVNAAERYKDFWPELRRMVYKEMIDHGIDPHCCFSDKDISSFANGEEK